MTRSSAVRFTSTGVRTVPYGNALPIWQGRIATKEESLSKAKGIAEDWCLQLRGKLRSREIKDEKSFREVSEQFLREYTIITHGRRN